MDNTISSVTVTINGTNITLESQDGLTWTKTCVAPTASSYPLTGGYYPVTVTAQYATGASTTISDQTVGTLGQSCRLVVKERVAPTATISGAFATNGSYLKDATQRLTLTLADNANGQTGGYSGVDLSTLTAVFTSTTLGPSKTKSLSGSDFTTSSTTGGYNAYADITFEDATDWVLTVNVSDNDGNAMTALTRSFTIDTVAPLLTVTAPVDNLSTATATVAVTGTTEAGATVSVAVDGGTASSVTVGANGAFSDNVTFTSSGTHTIVITATDSSGNTTTSTKTVWYSTDVPTIKSVTLSPNPADGGSTYVITVVVE